MKEKEIRLLPHAGLCNRLRAISSAVFLAKKLNRPLTIYWQNNDECASDFCDLFDPINIDIPIDVIEYKGLKYSIARKKNLYYPKLLRIFSVDKEILNFNCKEDGDIIPLISSDGITFIQTCHSITQHYDFQALFKPISSIMNAINSVTALYSDNTIGLHIRRTDNVQAIAHNDISSFENCINRELEADSSTKFYLATDDMYVKDYLINKYGTAILTFDIPLNRNTVEGMRGAVVDLWCLSKTKRIIGSFYSSYSEVASFIGKIDLEIVE